MCNAAMLPSVEATPRPRTRYFSARGCVIVDEDQRHVVVGGMLVGSFHVDDLAGRNVILVGLARDPRVHLERLAGARDRRRNAAPIDDVSAVVPKRSSFQAGWPREGRYWDRAAALELLTRCVGTSATARLNGRRNRVSASPRPGVRQLAGATSTAATEQRRAHARSGAMDLVDSTAGTIDGPANDVTNQTQEPTSDAS
jgi:hypothetical protein